MSNKSKRKQDHSPAKPENSSRDQYKRHIDGHVTIGGQIEVHPPPSSASAENTEREHQKTYRDKNYTVSWLTLVAVIIYAGLTFWQSCTTQKALDTAKQQFQLDRRPYVVFRSIDMIDLATAIVGQPTPGKPLAVNIRLTNVGKTPALNAIVHRHIVFGQGVQNIKVEPPDSKQGEIIAQGDTGTILTTAVSVQDTYTLERTAEIDVSKEVNWNGDRPIILFGRVTYEDSAGNQYCTPLLVRYLDTAWEHGTEWTINGTHHQITDLCPNINSY